MPTLSQVDKIYNEELLKRSPDEMAAAGDDWRDQLQGFFFPGNEDTVDQCALAVFRRSLALDGRITTAATRKQVRKVVNTDAVTDKAISIIFLACFTHQEQ